MQKSGPEKLNSLSFLVPKERSDEAVQYLRDTLKVEPVIISKHGMKLDRVVCYLPLKKNLEPILKSFKKAFSFRYRVQTKLIHEKDWRDKWKENFHSFSLTKQIFVRPSWEKPKKRKRKKIEVILDPGFAFGTGMHETTRFMVGMLEKRKKDCETFFDIGFGSGILPIIAAKLGIPHIEGIDFDPNALEAAKENIKLNAIENPIRLSNKKIESLTTKKQYDFIGANLDSHTLLENKEKIVGLMHKKSFLCISGIGRENRKEVHRAFKKSGLRCVRRYLGSSWCGFLYKKRKRGRLLRRKKRN